MTCCLVKFFFSLEAINTYHTGRKDYILTNHLPKLYSVGVNSEVSLFMSALLSAITNENRKTTSIR